MRQKYELRKEYSLFLNGCIMCSKKEFADKEKE